MNERPPNEGAPERVAHAVDQLARWLAQHWLATFNAIVAVFIGLPLLAPVLANAGAEGPARVIYAIYAPTCHQLPERSIWLFGPQAVYATSDLEVHGALTPGLNILQRMSLRFNGDPELGYKIAICQRDLGIYGSLLVSGLLFAMLRGPLARSGLRMARMPVWMFALLAFPMFADGATQLLGWRESWWLLRFVTGALFGSAVVWLAYPYVQAAMTDVLRPAVGSDAPETGQTTRSEV